MITATFSLHLPDIAPAITIAPAGCGRQGDYNLSGQDDQLIVNEALAAAPAGGAVVAILPGNVIISGPIRCGRDGITLVGSGAGERTGAVTTLSATGTRIVAGPAFTGPYLVEFARSDRARPLSHAAIRHLSIDGANLPNVTADGLYFSSFCGEIEDVNISRCPGNGLVVEGVGPTATAGKWQTYDCRYTGIRSRDNRGSGMVFGPHSPDSHSDRLMLYRNGEHGLVIGSASHQIGQVHAYNNGRHGVNVTAGTRSIVESAKVEQNGWSGLAIVGSSEVVVQTVRGKNNSAAGAGHAQVMLGAGAVYCTLAVVHLHDIAGEGGAVGLAPVGLQIAAWARDNVIGIARITEAASSGPAIDDKGLRTVIGVKAVEGA
jgi:hypothetical protein